ncbi:MAG: T9SS type A sorting domain-containing protein [Bacteroidota bacterium]|nr:T9SS type A sorting domain-containing protein [Bacteroidota bacterium]
MKKLYATAFAVLVSLSTSAQYNLVDMSNLNANPRELNPDPEQTAGVLNPLGWSTILSSGATNWSTGQTIPFTFKFNGATESTYYVHGDGLLSFSSGAAAPPATRTQLPNAGLPNKTVAMWGINISGANDAVISQTFGTAPYRQHWIMWSSASYTGVNWTYWAVVLEETTNNIYIVDQRLYSQGGSNVAITGGIQIDGSTATGIPGSPNLASKATNGGSADASDDNTVYGFYQGTLRDYDAYGHLSALPSFGQINTNVGVSAEVINFGTSAITSVEMKYSLNGGATQTAVVSGLNIAPGKKGIVTAPWTPTTAATYNVKMWFGNVNGNNDQDHLNDTINGSVDIVDALTQRISLLETFTSSTCGPCNPGNANMEGVLSNNPYNYASIKYQQNFPGVGDPYCTDEAVNRRGYYGVNAIPNTHIDGGWNGNSQSFSQGIYDQFRNLPAFMEMTATMSVSGQTVSGNVTMKPLKDYNSSNLKLYIGIVEKRTTQNIKTNGETEFFNVMKKMVPSENGKSVGPFTKNNNVSESYSYTFNGSYRLPTDGQPANRINHATEHSVEQFSDLAVVAWVQDDVTKEVMQAIDTRIQLSVEENTANVALKAFPNPANDKLNVQIDLANRSNLRIEMTNLLGQSVFSKDLGQLEDGTNVETIDVSSLAPGIYLLNVIDGKDRLTRKVIIE